VSEILLRLRSSGEDLVVSAFGHEGLRLLNFARSCDLAHPDLLRIQSLREKSDLLCQLLDLSKDALGRGHSLALGAIGRVGCEVVSECLKDIEPIRPRLLSLAERSELRGRKRPSSLSSSSFYRMARKSWGAAPSDFSSFGRHSGPDNRIVESLREKSKKFEQIGCHELCSSVMSMMVALGSPVEQYGFRRMDVATACVVLAKMNGFEPRDESIDAMGEPYVPKVYPEHELRGIMPDSLRALLAEEDAEASFKAVFDHHFVVVPSFGEGSSRDELRMLSAGQIRAAVLGERDGLCYFICDW